MNTSIKSAASALGRRGGKAKTNAKANAARANGRLGGRPAKSNNIGITKWAGGKRIQRVGETGTDDLKVIAWMRSDGMRAIETNGDPVFDVEDGFEDAWDLATASTTYVIGDLKWSAKVDDMYDKSAYFDAPIPPVFTSAWAKNHYKGADCFGVGLLLDGKPIS